jgi:GNAT superfamily N-acetyltransferase
MSVRVAAAAPGDAPALAALYAAAFDGSPLYGALFKSPGPARCDAMTWLFERRVAAALACSGPFLVAWGPEAQPGEQRRLLGAAAIMPRARASGLRAAWQAAKLLQWPYRCGLRSALAAVALVLRSRACASPPADGDVVMVAVAPSAQAAGVGALLLTRLLSEWDAAGGGALRLGTQSPRAVAFYARFGFRTTDAFDALGTRTWAMRRDMPQRGGQTRPDAAPEAAGG